MGVEVRMPKETFLQIVRRKGYPSRLSRFCCERLKEYKILDRCVIGVRREESKAREDRYQEPTQCLDYGKKKTPEAHVEAIYPILDWTSDDVAEYLTDRGIKCAPVYYDEQGVFHVERRLGCIGCPLITIRKRIAELKKYPNMVKALLRAGNDFLKSHQHTIAAQRYEDVYEYFTRNYFFVAESDFEENNTGLFGKPDYKEFLEETFGIDLTI